MRNLYMFVIFIMNKINEDEETTDEKATKVGPA